MNIIYARQDLPKSIFLAGPTPRHPDVLSWRPTALELLRAEGFNGTVFVPEDSSGCPKFDYDEQVEWEWECLRTATVALFWIPRELTDMPAFTTNIEFGMMAREGEQVVVGYPEMAPKNKYIGRLVKRFNVRGPYCTLEETVRQAIRAL